MFPARSVSLAGSLLYRQMIACGSVGTQTFTGAEGAGVSLPEFLHSLFNKADKVWHDCGLEIDFIESG